METASCVPTVQIQARDPAASSLDCGDPCELRIVDMLDADKRKAVFLLHQEGMGRNQIARQLRISPNTVQVIIQQKGQMPVHTRQDKIQVDPDLLQRLDQECDGYAQRVHEKLVEDERIQIQYSTLTRLLRELGLRRSREPRCERVPDEPGAEMQHDTTRYWILLGGVRSMLVASLLYLRYSKRRYLRFYRLFNRFRMKCFLHEALMFWRYAARVCIIDNTNLARWKGTGRDAVIVPEMEAFAKQYGFRFVCHEKGHANRKAGEERSFWTVETNFFPGRHFQSLEDLNQQAFQWATVRMEHRPVSKTGLIPAQAFEQERAALVALPAHLPAPYLCHERKTDQYGYVPLCDSCKAALRKPLLRNRSRSNRLRPRPRASGASRHLLNHPQGFPAGGVDRIKRGHREESSC